VHPVAVVVRFRTAPTRGSVSARDLVRFREIGSEPKSITPVTENGDEFFYIPFLGQYLAAIYRYSVAVASVIAVVILIVAGAQWTLSAGSTERIGSAKKRIAGAI